MFGVGVVGGFGGVKLVGVMGGVCMINVMVGIVVIVVVRKGELLGGVEFVK